MSSSQAVSIIPDNKAIMRILTETLLPHLDSLVYRKHLHDPLTLHVCTSRICPQHGAPSWRNSNYYKQALLKFRVEQLPIRNPVSIGPGN